MGSKWGTATIQEIAASIPHSISMGPFGSDIKTDNFVSAGVPIIRGVNLNADRFLDDKFVYLTTQKADELIAANAKVFDLIFTHRGSIGQVGIIPPNCRHKRYVVSQSQMKLTCDHEKVDPKFVFYFFKSRIGQHELLANTSTTGVPAISRPLTSLRTIRLPLPPINEQKAIANILWLLDDKIELNRKMNETLEEMARAIFKNWFIDFDPVRAKVEGRWKKGQSLPGMPAEIFDLWPDSFIDSPLGPIPKGWTVGKLWDSFKITMGQSPPGETYNENGEGLPFFQGRADFGFRYPTKRIFCTSPKRLAESGDTLISVRAPIGDINMANEKYCIGRGVAAFKHKSESRSYTYYFMQSMFEVFTSFESAGTVFGCIGKENFQGIDCIVPPNDLILEFERITFPIDQNIKNSISESRTLADIRDSLLPRLLSGEIRVKN